MFDIVGAQRKVGIGRYHNAVLGRSPFKVDLAASDTERDVKNRSSNFLPASRNEPEPGVGLEVAPDESRARWRVCGLAIDDMEEADHRFES